MVSNLALLRLQLDVLFTYDQFGRMVRVNEPDGERPPRLYLGRTPQGNLWRFRDDVPDALAEDLGPLLASAPFTSDPDRQLDGSGELGELLARHAAITQVWTGPAFHVPTTIVLPEGVTPVSVPNRQELVQHFSWLADEWSDRQPCRAIVIDGDAVAICFCARRSDQAAEAGVTTIAAYRGRGLAPLVVAAWAAAVRATGRVPLYSTSFSNVASRRVAEKLGLRLYGVDLAIT